jgi:putative SOS response-associated peptidase YedK
MMPVIVRQSPNHAVTMKWGLIPFWAKDPRIGYKLINARAETIDSKPSFKHAFQNKRCLIPANGFYEWQSTETGKQPYYINLKSGELMSFAGLYDTWRDAEGIKINTYTIITTKAIAAIKPIHHRMPLILDESEEDIWLARQASPAALHSLLQSRPRAQISRYPVSRMVNNPVNDSKKLLEPVPEDDSA